MRLSFIVPIYNVEPYLRKCVDSLLHQDYPANQYEIILVDDGSTDGSGELADLLASSPNIRVIHQKNRGLSGARNTGIAAALGEYICFVDSDDYWEENVLGGLMAQIERDKLDVLRFRWQNVKDDGKVFAPYKDMTDMNNYSSVPISGLRFLNERMGTRCYAVQFIIKRSLLIDNESSRESCLFTEGILFEDTEWVPRMLPRAKRVASTEQIVYNYLWRENGITNSKNEAKLRKELDNKLTLIGKLKEWNNGPWYEGMIASLVVSVIGIVAIEMYAYRKEYMKRLKDCNIFPLSDTYETKSGRRKVKLININPNLAVWMLHMKNKK